MPSILVSFLLPNALRLSDGDYQVAQPGELIHVVQMPLIEGSVARTRVQSTFDHDEITDQQEILSFKIRDADRLLLRTNRLLRWYRAVSRRADITELTKAQASPFSFEIIGGGNPATWNETLEFEVPILAPLELSTNEIMDRIRGGLGAGNEPDVADLFLLDAERALHQGRFRETILFCWSTIDAVFNQKYEQLVEIALVGEWAEAREFFRGYDFGLRNKMSAGMHLFANRSLFREPDDLWPRMSASYRKRNDIIHRGDNAVEIEATQAIEIARKIVTIMRAV